MFHGRSQGLSSGKASGLRMGPGQPLVTLRDALTDGNPDDPDHVPLRVLYLVIRRGWAQLCQNSRGSKGTPLGTQVLPTEFSTVLWKENKSISVTSSIHVWTHSAKVQVPDMNKALSQVLRGGEEDTETN